MGLEITAPEEGLVRNREYRQYVIRATPRVIYCLYLYPHHFALTVKACLNRCMVKARLVLCLRLATEGAV